MSNRYVPVLSLFALRLFAQAVPQENLISVTGDAEIKVIPNQVVITLGVETRDASLANARSANDNSVRAVLNAIKGFSVDPSDIQTDYMSVQIGYDNNDPSLVRYYEVEKSIALTLKEVSRFEAMLTAVLDAGANRIYNVDFMTTELRKYRDQARTLAVKAAMEKAGDLAASAGLRVVGNALNMSSYSFGGGPSYGRYRLGGFNQAQNVYQNASGGAAAGTVALGKISVTASVTLSYRLESAP
ncbi:MAG: SIMPL domain-containing protein [Bryobacteraceae bacterium]